MPSKNIGDYRDVQGTSDRVTRNNTGVKLPESCS